MISIIIPTLNEAGVIEAALADLAGRPTPAEVIVADGASSDATASLAAGFKGVTVMDAPRGRARQMNAEAARAGGEILLFLHADTRLPPGGLGMILEALARPQVLAGCFCLTFDHQHPLLGLYARFSRINLALFSYGDQGLFLRARDFAALGGFKDIEIMEDLEMQRRLRRRGRVIKLDRAVTTSARRFLQNGILKQELSNILLVGLYSLGMPPARIERLYR